MVLLIFFPLYLQVFLIQETISLVRQFFKGATRFVFLFFFLAEWSENILEFSSNLKLYLSSDYRLFLRISRHFSSKVWSNILSSFIQLQLQIYRNNISPFSCSCSYINYVLSYKTLKYLETSPKLFRKLVVHKL